MKENRICVFCKKQFLINGSNKRKTCSANCRSLYIKTQEYIDFVNSRRKAAKLLKYGDPYYNNSSKIKETKNKLNKPYNIEKQKQTLLEKYGDSTYRNIEKSKQTKLEKYGDEFFSNKESAKQTKLEKYGNENFTNREKAKQTSLQRYGNEHYCNPDKIKKTNLKKYGHDNFSKTDKFKKMMFDRVLSRLDTVIPLFNYDSYSGVSGFKYKFKCKTCNNDFSSSIDNGKIPICTTCYPSLSGTSLVELEIVSFIKQHYSGEMIQNDRTILNGQELDIYLPQLNLAIEVDGIYYHSEISGNKNKNYHVNKTNICDNKGIRLIHIFDTEWINFSEKIKSLLLNLIITNSNRIFARRCIIKELPSSDCNLFLNHNHLQGEDKSSIRLGLFHNGELVSVMTFGKSRYDKTLEWEMYRFCNKLNISIVGGANKLFKYFVNRYDPKSIVSFSDNRFFNGNVYGKLGFKFKSNSAPNYFYFNKNRLYSRQKFQKHKLKNILEIFDSNLSEWQNMQMNGYDRIWDCGNKKWIWSK